MRFTYDGYRQFLGLLRENGYAAAGYDSWKEHGRCVILRHDIDMDISSAVRIACLEQEERVTSTFFVLLTSDFYNVFSKENSKRLQRILECGHAVGLHFDPARYPETDGNAEALKQKITAEARLLETVVGRDVRAFSMHRPGKGAAGGGLEIPGMADSYGKEFFHGFKYLSDSRKHWREPVDGIVASGRFPRLHILTHPFWYSDMDKDMYTSLNEFVKGAGRQRFDFLKANITDLESVMRMDGTGNMYRYG